MPCMPAQDKGCAPTANPQPTTNDTHGGGAHKRSPEGVRLIWSEVHASEAVERPTSACTDSGQEHHDKGDQVCEGVRGCAHGSCPFSWARVPKTKTRHEQNDGQWPEQCDHGSLLVVTLRKEPSRTLGRIQNTTGNHVKDQHCRPPSFACSGSGTISSKVTALRV